MNNIITSVGKIITYFCLFVWIGVNPSRASEILKVGWATSDITPEKPVLLRGQFYARMSENILDPIGATALSLESSVTGETIRTLMISCDLVSIPDYLRDHVRQLVVAELPELSSTDITISATHTHTAPMMDNVEVRTFYGMPMEWLSGGKDVMTPLQYTSFAAQRIADAAIRSWKNRKPGGISFGLGKAVLGHNRLIVDKNGNARMYGSTDSPDFSHVEGYEDHNLNLLYTWNTVGKLTGVVINAAVTAQVSGHLYEISADFWTEVKALMEVELRDELADHLFILPQVSAAGDQSPWTVWDEREEIRMQELMGFGMYGTGRRSIGRRMQIARHITDGVKAILPYMKANIEWNPILAQRTETVPLSRRSLEEVNEEFLRNLNTEVVERKHEFDRLYAEVTADPGIRTGNRWYKDLSTAFSHYNRALTVQRRYQNPNPANEKMPVEVKVIRIGDMAFATNPFELYLDYGIQMKSRSPAVQTFVVQLTGGGTYVPTQRGIDGGGYGSAPASTPVGPKGGTDLVEATLVLLKSLWP